MTFRATDKVPKYTMEFTAEEIAALRLIVCSGINGGTPTVRVALYSKIAYAADALKRNLAGTIDVTYHESKQSSVNRILSRTVVADAGSDG